MDWLLENGAKVMVDNLGGSPLHDAAEHGRLHVRSTPELFAMCFTGKNFYCFFRPLSESGAALMSRPVVVVVVGGVVDRPPRRLLTIPPSMDGRAALTLISAVVSWLTCAKHLYLDFGEICQMVTSCKSDLISSCPLHVCINCLLCHFLLSKLF